jgi:hypothetical protein
MAFEEGTNTLSRGIPLRGEWARTKRMEDRLKRKFERRDGVLYYQDRRVIRRDSSVDGGVYLGENEREAIVVDSEKYPALKKLYAIAERKMLSSKLDAVALRDFLVGFLEAKKRGLSVGEFVKELKVLRAVYETVAEAMPNQSEEAVEELMQKIGVGPDEKVRLDDFIDAGVGVCRHDALACAGLLEMFKRNGLIKGKISVDRNSYFRFGHAWSRYETPYSVVKILDVALGYYGDMKDAPKEWPYERPEEY